MIKGFIRIVATDVNTGKVVYDVEKENSICHGILEQLINYHRMAYNSTGTMDSNVNIPAGPGTTGSILPAVVGVITSSRYHTLKSMSNMLPTGTYLTGYIPLRVDYPKMPKVVPATQTTPWYLEWYSRFDPPASSDRTIYNVFLNTSSSTSTPIVSAMAELETPCVQTITQVVDIYYRVQVIDVDSGILGNSIVSKEVTQAMVKSMANSDFDAYRSGVHPTHTTRIFGGNLSSNVNFFTFSSAGSHGNVNSTCHRRSLTKTLNTKLVKNNLSFAKASSLNDVFNGGLSGVYVLGCQDINDHAIGVLGMIGSDSNISKIQPIHNHGPLSLTPALDVSNLARGSGRFNIFDISWSQNVLPSMYKVKIQDSGSNSTAKYSLDARKVVRFYSSTSAVSWNSHVEHLDHLFGNSLYYSADGSYIKTHPELYDNLYNIATHGLLTLKQQNIQSGYNLLNHMIHVNGSVIAAYDATGITLVDIWKNEIKSFDSLSTPSLNAVNIRQVSVVNGKIWVADSVTGLFKIDPITSTVTKVTINGVTDSFFAVTKGTDNTVFAVANGGICVSADNGSSWSVYNESSPIQFNYSGISNNNWSKVLTIKADQENNNLGIVRTVTEGVAGEIVWWNPSTGVSVTGPSIVLYPSVVFKHNSFECSKTGGFWAINEPELSTRTKILKFGTTSKTMVSSSYSDTFGNPSVSLPVSFEYDCFGSPMLYTSWWSDTNRNSTISDSRRGCFVDKNGNLVGWNQGSPNSDAMSYPVCRLESGSWLRIKLNNPSSTTSASNTYTGNVVLYQFTPNTSSGFIDANNGDGSVFEDLCWTKYKWNGTEWDTTYSVDVPDSSSSNNPAKRMNFDADSTAFKGRQCLDVSSCAESPLSSITFLATASYTTKHNLYQNRSQVMFAAKHSTVPGSLVVYLVGTSTFDKVCVYDGVSLKTVGTSPVSGSSNRIAVKIDGSTLSVFINGSKLGTDVTLAAPISFDTSSNGQKFYVGGTPYSQDGFSILDGFFKGTIDNIQVWGGALLDSEIISDNSNPSGVISSSTPLLGRYITSNPLPTTESKVASGTTESLIDGLSIKFNAGASEPSYVAGDYYNFVVADKGIFNDNAVSYNFKVPIYYTKVESAFNDFGGTLSATQQTVSEKVYYTMISPTEATKPRKLIKSGEFAFNGATSQSDLSTVCVAQSFQESLGDIEHKFKVYQVIDSNYQCTVGISTIVPTSTNAGYSLNFKHDGSVDVVENGTVKQAAATTFVYGDEFTIKRIGTTVTYYKGTTLFYTSVTPSTGTVRSTIITKGYVSVDNSMITYSRSGEWMDIGNSTTETGKFAADFLAIDYEEAASITIDGNITATSYDTSSLLMSSVPTPGPGQTIVIPFAGLIKTNVADVGKTLAGSVIMVYL